MNTLKIHLIKTTSLNVLLAAGASLLIISCSPKPANTSFSEPTAAPLLEAKALSRAVENRIEGAFGKKFGDVFDPSTATGIDALEDGTPMYRFKPDKPFGSIDTYFVFVTPSSHKIYSILARGKVGVEQASSDLDVIMKMVEQKYGAQPKDEHSHDLDDYDNRHYSQGTRSVSMSVHRYTHPIIMIRYDDFTLIDVANAERAELAKQKAKTLDNSGL